MARLKQKTKSKGRRGNNEGTIYKRNDGSGRWCGEVTIGYKDDGTPKRKSFYGKTRAEVATKVTALVNEITNTGFTTVATLKDYNFKVLFDSWFNDEIAGRFRSYTLENRRSLHRIHLFPTLGTMDVRKIDSMLLKKLFSSKANDLVHDTLNKLRHTLNGFFVYALKQHIVQENPMVGIEVKSNKRSKSTNLKALREDIRQQVFMWVAENPLLKPIVITFALTGLRPQELLVLPWTNVKLDKQYLLVTEALKRTVTDDKITGKRKIGTEIGDTKTESSVRKITLPSVVVSALREWQDYCKANAIISDFVFPTKNGTQRTYAGLRSLLNRFIRQHKLQAERITLYTFRHTFATMLLEKRENPRIVANLMGHKKTSTTLDTYSHVVSDNVYKTTAQTLDDVFTQLCL